MLLLCGFFSCSKSDESILEEKWKLISVENIDGTKAEAGAVFYNFQKGSFSAICIDNDAYHSFYGNYALNEKVLSIVIIPENTTGEVYEKYIGWEEGSNVFVVEQLTSSRLRLRDEERILTFRKY
nr:lipocalin-like domain-containing protein [Bacteroides sp. 214]